MRRRPNAIEFFGLLVLCFFFCVLTKNSLPSSLAPLDRGRHYERGGLVRLTFTGLRKLLYPGLPLTRSAGFIFSCCLALPLMAGVTL